MLHQLLLSFMTFLDHCKMKFLALNRLCKNLNDYSIWMETLTTAYGAPIMAGVRLQLHDTRRCGGTWYVLHRVAMLTWERYAEVKNGVTYSPYDKSGDIKLHIERCKKKGGDRYWNGISDARNRLESQPARKHCKRGIWRDKQDKGADWISKRRNGHEKWRNRDQIVPYTLYRKNSHA